MHIVAAVIHKLGFGYKKKQKITAISTFSGVWVLEKRACGT